MNTTNELSAVAGNSPLTSSNFPAYAGLPEWCRISGMGRSKAYEALGAGHLRAVKLGVKTLIDVQHGLTWLGSLPQATIRPHGAKRTKQVA